MIISKNVGGSSTGISGSFSVLTVSLVLVAVTDVPLPELFRNEFMRLASRFLSYPVLECLLE